MSTNISGIPHRQRWVSGICTIALAVSAPALAQQQAKPQQAQQPQSQQQPAQSVELNDLENNASTYMGKKVRVNAEVDEVLGPRVFAIDEGGWLDIFRPRKIVVVPAPMAALVREGAAVTITGTVRPFVQAEFEREWGWFGESEMEVDLKDRTVIVADAVVTENGTSIAVVPVDSRGQQAASGQQTQPQQQTGTQPQTAQQSKGQQGAVGTSGRAEGMDAPPVTDMNQLATATDARLVGRRATLQNARGESNLQNGGFWVSTGTGSERLFVVPENRNAQISQGQTVTINGIVLELPEGMRSRIGGDSRMAQDEEIYVFAQEVKQGG
jgi:hypothetical protein